MRHYFLSASSILFISLTSAAYSADVVVMQEPTEKNSSSPYNWSGAYLGGQVGHSWAKTKYSLKDNDDFEDFDSAGSENKGAFIGGVYAGYNFDLGNNFILGGEVDITKGFQSQKNSFLHDDSGHSASTELAWNGAMRARMGYAVNKVMPYLAGGLAFGSIKNTLTINEEFDDGETISKTKTRTGWTVGGGVDYAATDNVILRLEYRYTDFGKQNFDLNGNGTASSKLSTNDIRIGVAYKF
ncbi:outer membrane protein [Brucella sp. H1_1004]|uniref:outer membrane protein n=1 Tax=Brucella sp. H1_1004 TaxID=3110109 RepID=UPI0039B476D8